MASPFRAAWRRQVGVRGIAQPTINRIVKIGNRNDDTGQLRMRAPRGGRERRPLSAVAGRRLGGRRSIPLHPACAYVQPARCL